jgi:hypothetical protein
VEGQAFQKDNKTPDPLALKEAVDASILRGNVTILDQAAPNAKVDQKFNLDDLNAIASGSNDKQLPAGLKYAAAPKCQDRRVQHARHRWRRSGRAACCGRD